MSREIQTFRGLYTDICNKEGNPCEFGENSSIHHEIQESDVSIMFDFWNRFSKFRLPAALLNLPSSAVLMKKSREYFRAG